MTDFHQIFTKW